MASDEQILKRVLIKIKPSEKEEKRIKELSNRILAIANEEAAKYEGKAILAGSLTRDTWLPNKNEIDVFILFPKTFSKEKLEEVGLKLGKIIVERLQGKWKVEYAQHPYIRGVINKIQVDLVPCYHLSPGEKIISAVDRTQFHVDYLNKKLPEKLSDDVRLLKQLLKANGLYGADSKTSGFSGYLCELLIINYGSFIDLLKSACQWKVKEIIDIENLWKQQDYHHLKKKFKDEILIVIDPVDKERNVASPLSVEVFYKFKKIANQFIKSPDESIFFKQKEAKLTPSEFDKYLKNRGTEIIAVVFKPPKIVPDILWPQLRKATKRLEAILREYEFVTLRSDCWTDEKNLAVIILEMQVGELPKIDKIKGPLVFDEKNANNFAKKHEKDAITGPFIEDVYWFVEVNRKWTTAKTKLIDSLSEKEKILMDKGIPNYIAKQIAGGFKILSEDGLKKLLNNKEFAIFMKKYFEKENLFI